MSRHVDTVVLHHTASRWQVTTPKRITWWHTNPKPPEGHQLTAEDEKRFGNGWKHIGYHWVIWCDGGTWVATPTLDEGVPGIHAAPHNRRSIAVCLCGDYDKQLVEPQAWALLRVVVADIVRRHGIEVDRVLGHRETQPEGKTRCPGANYPIAQLREELRRMEA